MRVHRGAFAALVGGAALLVGSGTAALAGSSNPCNGQDHQAACQASLARVAAHRGVSVDQLEAQIKAKLTARVDAALQAGKITAGRAAALKARIAGADLCSGVLRHHGVVRREGRRMLRAAAGFLGLDRAQLRAQLAGTSLAALAQKQGKSTADLKTAMLAPANARLAKAVAAGHVSQARADQLLARLGTLADALISKTFPAK